MIRPGESGGRMVMMHMGMDKTVARHLREVVVVMPGRVMVLLRDLFLALWVVLLRGRLALTTGSEVDTGVLVVVVVGTVTGSLLHLWLITRRPLSWQPIPVRRRICLLRLWTS